MKKKKKEKLNREDYWILYRLINYHLNNISELAVELKIRPELSGQIQYMERLEKVEHKLETLI